MERKVDVIEDLEGRKVVLIHDIRFKGKRQIDWKDVEEYLKQYVGEVYEIGETAEKIYIGKDLSDEYSWSEDTKRLKGTLAKAKANASQGIPELIQIAIGSTYSENFENKHKTDAKYGWYRYDTRFALPVYNEEDEIERYNIFRIRMLVRHAANGKKYLYDFVNIKKETSKPL